VGKLKKVKLFARSSVWFASKGTRRTSKVKSENKNKKDNSEGKESKEIDSITFLDVCCCHGMP
jgi:hypothetical protein